MSSMSYKKGGGGGGIGYPIFASRDYIHNSHPPPPPPPNHANLSKMGVVRQKWVWLGKTISAHKFQISGYEPVFKTDLGMAVCKVHE